jgi:hypothetical protein
MDLGALVYDFWFRSQIEAQVAPQLHPKQWIVGEPSIPANGLRRQASTQSDKARVFP